MNIRTDLIAIMGAATLLAGAPGGLQGQVHRGTDLHGRVVTEAGAPIGAARVRVLELRVEEQTHADGRFHFGALPVGSYTVRVGAIGYGSVVRPVSITPDGPTELTVTLAPAAVTLPELAVTGTLPGRADDVLSPTSSLSGRALDRQLSGTVAATLENQPGVSSGGLGPATARPVIRGLGGDRILVLEDGQRPGDLSSTSADHAVAVEPLTAERVEVVRGPMSLIYGSSALGGVVNVVREEIPEELPEHLHGTVSLQGSSVNSGGSAGGYALGRAGPVALRAEASVRGSGDVRTPAGRLGNTRATTLNAAAGASLVRGWGHAGGSYRFYDSDYGIPGGFVGGHPEGVDVEMRRHSVRGEAELRPRNSRLVGVHADATYTDYRHAEVEQSGAIGTEFGQQTLSADAVARHAPLGFLREGAFGVRAQYRDIETGGSLRTPSTYDYTLAGFLVEELSLGTARLQAGVRYDWARYVPRDTTATVDVGGVSIPVRPRTFGALSASIGLLVPVVEGLQAGVSVSRAYRTPDFNELYSNGPHLAANTYDVGDPRIDRETGVGLDAFVRVGTARLRAEAAAFSNVLHGYIFPSSRGRAELGGQGARARFQYTNEDAKFTGAEGGLEWSVGANVVVEATLSYVRAVFTEPRDSIPVFDFENNDTTFVAASPHPPFVPPLNGRAGLRYERPSWFAGLGVRAAARQDRVGDFEEPTPGYAVADVTAGARIPFAGRIHSLTLGIDNLLDREYRDHLSRTKAIMPEPGRNVTLLYRLDF